MTSSDNVNINTIDRLIESDAEPEIKLQVSAWARGLCMPVSTISDPRYGDRYVEIKHEIDKLADTDYSRIFELSKQVLTHEAKDLRVAGYLLLSATHVEGVQGLVDAIEIYHVILDRYWDECFPKAELARANAISWINNKKIAYFIERSNEEFDQDLLVALRQCVDSFNHLITKRTNSRAQTFTEINRWMESAQRKVDEHSQQREQERQQRLKLEQEKAQQEKELALLEQLQEEEHERQNQVSALANRLVGEEAHRKIVVQRLISSLLKENNYLQAIMYAAACQWSMTKISESTSSVTELDFPAELDLQILRVIENPAQRFISCIDAFLYSNGEFCFDVQHIAFGAAREMHDKNLSSTIKRLVGDLLYRHPGLIELSFSDGTSFANEECREWLDEIINSRTEFNPLTTFVKQSNSDNELALALEQAREIVVEEDLKSGIRHVSSLSVSDELSRVKQKLNMAILCVENERTDLALPVLNEMFNYTNKYSLHVWQPALAMLLWQTLHSVLTVQKENASEILRDKIDERLNAISEQMCTADLSMASQLLN